jgi:hypothetical protein
MSPLSRLGHQSSGDSVRAVIVSAPAAATRLDYSGADDRAQVVIVSVSGSILATGN